MSEFPALPSANSIHNLIPKYIWLKDKTILNFINKSHMVGGEGEPALRWQPCLPGAEPAGWRGRAGRTGAALITLSRGRLVERESWQNWDSLAYPEQSPPGGERKPAELGKPCLP